MEKTTVTANKDNDLKYRTGLEDPKKKKNQNEEQISESSSGTNGGLEYFTE